MATNVTAATKSGKHSGYLLQSNPDGATPEMESPTLESLQQDLATFANIRDEKLIEGLESRLHGADRKIELKEKNAADKKIRVELDRIRKEEVADATGQSLRGVSCASTDAAGDGDSKSVTSLLEENAALKKRVRQLEMKGQPGLQSIQDGMESVRLGGVHPESCPSSVSSGSLQSRDAADSSTDQTDLDADRQMTDKPNTHLPHGVPPAGTTAQTLVATTVAAAAVSQANAFHDLQSSSSDTADHASDKKVIRGVITDDMIEWLSENVGVSDWKSLLRRLGLSNVEIDDIVHSSSMHAREQRYQGFLTWRKNSSTATVTTLLRVLRKKSLHQLSREFCESFPKETALNEETRQNVLGTNSSADLDGGDAMATNVTAATKSGKHNGYSLQSNPDGATPEMEPPTLESLQRDLVRFANIRDGKIEELESRLHDRDHEILELKQKNAAWLLEKKSLKDEIKKLRVEMERTGQSLRGVSYASTDAAGDGDSKSITTLREENAALRERVRQLELKGQPGLQSVQDGMENLRLCRDHPESCPSSVSSGSLRSRDTADSSTDQTDLDADCQMTDKPNTHLPRGVPPAGTTIAEPTVATAVQAAAASQANVFHDVQSSSSETAEHASDKKVIKGVITDGMIEWLSENVSVSDWKPLLRKLGLSNGDIDDIAHSHYMHAKEQRYQGFLTWRKKNSRVAKVSTLLRALQEKSLYQLHREFRKCFPEESALGEEMRPNALEVDSSAVTFSCSLERYMNPFLKENAFRKFKEELRNCGKLSMAQIGELGCTMPQGNYDVDAVLELWAAAYYRNKPDDEMEKRKALWKTVRICGKKVRDVFKKHVNQAGVIGPAIKEDTKIEQLPYSMNKNIEELLSLDEGMANWKDLAEFLKREHGGVFDRVTKNKIKLWERENTGAKNVLSIWETTTQATAGKLYLWLVQNGRCDIAETME